MVQKSPQGTTKDKVSDRPHTDWSIVLTILTLACTVLAMLYTKLNPNSPLGTPVPTNIGNTDVITWLSTEKEARAVDDMTLVFLVVAVVANSDPRSKHFLYRYKLAATKLQNYPDIRFYAADVEEAWDVGWYFIPKHIGYPFVVYASGNGILDLDRKIDIATEVLKEYKNSADENQSEELKRVKREREKTKAEPIGDDEVREVVHQKIEAKVARYFYEEPEDLKRMLPTLKALRSENFGLYFGSVDVGKTGIGHYLDEDPRKAPYFMIQEKNGLCYGLDTPSEESVRQFVEDFKAKRLRPSFKSEPVPSELTHPLKIVGRNHDEVLRDMSKSFLIMYYKEVDRSRYIHAGVDEKTWKKLCEYFADKEDLIIAEMDIWLNYNDTLDEGIFFYPAGALGESGSRECIKYPYGTLYETLKYFLERGGNTDSWIPVVSAASFNQYLTNHDMVVAYYNGFDYNFEFPSAAEALAHTHPNIQFVKVNSTGSTVRLHDIVLYYKGAVVEILPLTDLKRRIVSTFYPVNVVQNESDWIAFQDVSHERNLPVAIMVNAIGSQVFSEVAFAHRKKFQFAELESNLNDFVAKKYGISLGDAPALVVIYPESPGEAHVYTGVVNRESLEEYLQIDTTPVLYDFGPGSAGKPFPDRIQAIYFYQERAEIGSLLEPLRELARKYPRIAFGHTDLKYVELLSDYRQIKILKRFQGSIFVIKEPQPYVLEPSVSANKILLDAIADFMAEYLAGRLSPFQPQCRGPDPVEFDEVSLAEAIKDTTKHVLVWYHQIGIKFSHLDALAEHFFLEPNVVVGKVSFAELDLDEPFPDAMYRLWLILYPAGGEVYKETGLRKPIVYDGPVNLSSLKNFVTTGSPVFELTAKTAPAFMKSAHWGLIKLYRSSSPNLEDDANVYGYMLQKQKLELMVGQIDLDVGPSILRKVMRMTRPLKVSGVPLENLRLCKNVS